MKTITSAGTKITLDLLQLCSLDELERIMDLGLHHSTFLKLAQEHENQKSLIMSSFSCSQKKQTPVALTLSPRIFLSSDLTELESIAAIAAASFEIAKAIYQGEVKGIDRGDLNVWFELGLPLKVHSVSNHFIKTYENDKNMVAVNGYNGNVALGSFSALRRLVITDD